MVWTNVSPNESKLYVCIRKQILKKPAFFLVRLHVLQNNVNWKVGMPMNTDKCQE